ncbi:hypothetical protein GCM10019017_60870 [Streptomyces showdoensis]
MAAADAAAEAEEAAGRAEAAVSRAVAPRTAARARVRVGGIALSCPSGGGTGVVRGECAAPAPSMSANRT